MGVLILMLMLMLRSTSADAHSGIRIRPPLAVAIGGVVEVVRREVGGDGRLVWTLAPVLGRGGVGVCAEWHSREGGSGR